MKTPIRPKFSGEYTNKYKNSLFRYMIKKINIQDEYKIKEIKNAYELAYQAHQGQMRKAEKKTPYIIHPVEVAIIIAREMGLGITCIKSALLHDVVEDTDYDIEFIEKKFGKKVATIVSGVTKITAENRKKSKTETLKRLLQTFHKQPEVLLIKIADRLHNMRTMANMPQEKQKIKAKENIEHYIPMAYSVGLYDIKKELEDLSFRYYYPEQYQWIKDEIKKLQKYTSSIFSQNKKRIEEFITKHFKIDYTITYEHRSLYSIYQKILKLSEERGEDASVEDVHNFKSIRIIFNAKNIRQLAQKFINLAQKNKLFEIKSEKDFISKPKSNGFRALIIDAKFNSYIHELQIISEIDHIISHKGFIKGRFHNNMKHLQSRLDEINYDYDSEYLLTRFKEIANPNFIEAYTPKGDSIILPKGATVIDFAYHIHEAIGNYCLGAQIDNKYSRGPEYKIHDGETLKIITASKLQVKESWLNTAITPRALRSIRKILRKQNKDEQMSQSTSENSCPKSQNEINLDKINNHLIICDNTEYKTAPCCNILVNEKAQAIQEKTGIIYVHHHKCSTLKKKRNQGYKIIDIDWQIKNIKNIHSATIHLTGFDKQGAIQEISQIITNKINVNMKKFFMFATEGGFEGYIELEITFIEQLKNLINTLQKNEYISKAERIRNFDWDKLLKQLSVKQ